MSLFSRDFLLLWWLSSSYTGAGHFLGISSLTPVSTQQTQETQGVCPAFHPGCHSPQSLLSSVGRAGRLWGALISVLQSQSARLVLLSDFWSDTGRSANKPNPILVLPFSPGWISLWGMALWEKRSSHQVLPAATFGLISAKGRGTDSAVDRQTLALAQVSAGTVTPSKQPGAAAALLSQPSHRSSVSPSLLLCLSSEFLGFCLSLFPHISGTDMSCAVPRALLAIGFSLKLQLISWLSTYPYLLTNIPHHSSKGFSLHFLCFPS